MRYLAAGTVTAFALLAAFLPSHTMTQTCEAGTGHDAGQPTQISRICQ